jgi:undecaprenyl-diphosphatase
VRSRATAPATLTAIDWALFHLVNTGVATRDWLEDPVTTFATLAVPVYAFATVALWFVSRPPGLSRWRVASVSALVAAAVALVANQAIAHVWDRPRPFTTHAAATHLLSAPSPDPSFPSDHAAAAFAIAFCVLAVSRWAGVGFLAAATAIGLSRIALGMHYPSDVLAGMLVGWVAAVLMTQLGRPFVERIAAFVGRATDRVLTPIWTRAAELLPARRGHEKPV